MKYDPTIAARLKLNFLTSRKMSGPISIHRVPYERLSYKRFLLETLGLTDEDLETKEKTGQRLNALIAEPCVMPTDIHAKNHLEVDAFTNSLMRHLGVDPVRLLLAGHDARMQATDGVRSITMKIDRALGKERDAGAPDRLDIKITLAPGVFWKGSRLTARKTALPQSIVGTLQGRPIRDVVGHDWDGWDAVRITSAQRKGDSLVIDTDACGTIPLQG
jgi:hypothetical protein